MTMFSELLAVLTTTSQRSHSWSATGCAIVAADLRVGRSDEVARAALDSFDDSP